MKKLFYLFICFFGFSLEANTSTFVVACKRKIAKTQHKEKENRVMPKVGNNIFYPITSKKDDICRDCPVSPVSPVRKNGMRRCCSTPDLGKAPIVGLQDNFDCPTPPVKNDKFIF